MENLSMMNSWRNTISPNTCMERLQTLSSTVSVLDKNWLIDNTDMFLHVLPNLDVLIREVPPVLHCTYTVHVSHVQNTMYMYMYMYIIKPLLKCTHVQVH